MDNNETLTETEIELSEYMITVLTFWVVYICNIVYI